MNVPGAHVLAGLGTIADELGIGAPVARLLKDAWGAKSFRNKDFYLRLKKLREGSEEFDAPPRGWISADDAEAIYGEPLRALMLAWVGDQEKMRFDYIRGVFTPLLSLKELMLLMRVPKWTSVSLVAREEGLSYGTIYHRLRPTALERRMFKGWRGARVHSFLREAVDWERRGWASTGHTSSAIISSGPRIKTNSADNIFAQARGYEVAAEAVLSVTKLREVAIRKKQSEARAEKRARKAEARVAALRAQLARAREVLAAKRAQERAEAKRIKAEQREQKKALWAEKCAGNLARWREEHPEKVRAQIEAMNAARKAKMRKEGK